MPFIFDFAINYRSDDNKLTTEMLVPAPNSNQINKLSNSGTQIKKKRLNLPFDSHFVSCSYESKFRGHFWFFLSNLLVSNPWTNLIDKDSEILPMFKKIDTRSLLSNIFDTIFAL